MVISMGTSGPGNIVHIDNLYVKTLQVKDNVSIIIGDYVVYELATDKIRPLVIGDFSGDDAFLDLSTIAVFQAGESSNNLTTTDPLLRKTECECITVGSDWVTTMRAGTRPTESVGILRVDADDNKFQTSHKTAAAAVVGAGERLGQYKHKEFLSVAVVSTQDEDGVVSTGVGVS